MNPENIKARLSIGKREPGDVAYIFDYNLLNQLNVAPDSSFRDYHFLSIGAEFEFNEKRYRVTEIKPFFFGETVDMSNAPGFNMNRLGNPLAYNFEIALFVEEI